MTSAATAIIALAWVVGSATAQVATQRVRQPVSRPVTQPGLRRDVDPVRVTLLDDGRPLLRYRYGDVAFKPYIEELCTPRGVNVLLDAPPDHKHHHGLMLAITVDGVNFWEEGDQAGRQRHASFVLGGPPSTYAERLEWRDKEDRLRLSETRTLSLIPGAHGATLVSWVSALEANGSDASLGGSHYQGLGLRFVPAMNDRGRFFNAEDRAGEVFRGDERLVQARWCAYTAEIDGRPVTVAMFDHPDNPRPATWFTMKTPFAYLSATLALHAEPLRLEQGKVLTLRYGVAVSDGAVEPAAVERVYAAWLDASRVP